jgi:DNA-binding NtrC family response regulator
VANLLELGETTREVRRLGGERMRHRKGLADRFDMAGMVFAASATARVVELACQVARADVPVLITGPNGTGKERIAAIIQANSAVRDGPFITVNCGALPAELIEAELFGADAGAYTSANRAREGRFEAADGGTLFLDEIGNLPLSGQIKLLRVLETGCFERLGSSRTRQVKVRLISATNADLAAMIAAGNFRQDLYYRLNVIEIRMPALAERRDDIPLLVEHFLAGRAALSEAARRALLQHDWPGNVRELKNAIERAVLLCGDAPIAVEHLALPAPRSLPAALDEPDRASIEEVLARHGGVVAQAASELGLSRQALYRRMDKLGMR